MGVTTYIRRSTILLSLLPTALPALAQQEDMSTIFDGSHILAYFVAGVLISLFVLAFRNRLFVYRERELNAQNRSQIAQMALVLRSCKVRVWTYDVVAHQFRLLSESGAVEGIYSTIDFSQSFERDDFERLRQEISAIQEGTVRHSVLTLRGRKNLGESFRQYEVSLKILQADSHDRPQQLLGLQRDITEEQEKQEKVGQLLMQYHQVFNQSLVDMVYYDSDGVMSDINDKACETFGIANRQAFLASKPRLEDNPGFDASMSDGDGHHFSAVIDSKHQLSSIRLKNIGVTDTIYFEMSINGIYDSANRLAGIFSAGRNITETVENYHHQQEARRQLRHATQRVQRYIENINYALQVSEVRLVNYYPDRHVLEISSNLSEPEYVLTQMRCLGLVAPDHQHHAKRLLRQMDRGVSANLGQVVRTVLRDKQGRDVWLVFNFLPVTGADGRIDHYFGMCRNETEMISTELLLKQETQKAQETELLKNSFLMNMSHEIRTPLNAVLGFASLFNGEHDVADEPVFVEQIKENANRLLELVNDVLYLSRLDAHMIEMNHQPTDFVNLFTSDCEMGWANVLHPGVKTLVENPYSQLVVDIDEQHLGQVLIRLCGYAAFHTLEGYVRASYEYRRGELNITVEDTGPGLSEEELPHVFDRFVNSRPGASYGTGLALPIAKELVEQMGGVIDISSKRGEGTTIWVTIPCELTGYDRHIELPTTMADQH